MNSRILILITLLSLSLGLFAQSERIATSPIYRNDVETKELHSQHRDVPEWSFARTPMDIMTNYYDYMPGSYNGNPMRTQPAETSPYGYDGNGVYLVFHGQESANSSRRQYFCYIDEDGVIQSVGTIGQDDIHEGYGGNDIDPITGNPFMAWHQQFGPNADDDWHIVLAVDAYNLLGGPGLMTIPEPVISHENPACHAHYPRQDNVYCWPHVNIGLSPMGEGYKRVYITARNNQEHEEQYPAYNPIVAYADYQPDVSTDPATFTWNWTTIPQMDAFDCEGDEYRQVNLSFVVSPHDGTVAFIGYDNMNQDIFCYVNHNYAEGDWDEYIQPYHMWVDNPLDQSGNPTFVDEAGAPYDSLMFAFTRSSHFNAVANHAFTKIYFPGHAALRRNQPDDTFNWWYSLVFPKVWHFDLTTGTFGHNDLYPQGANPGDDQPMLPWDLDENGQVDEFSDEGDVLMVGEWPIYNHDENVAGDENNWKICKNDTWGMMAVVWQSAINARRAEDGITGYEDWVDKSEIFIAISSDQGQTWSDPIIMNAVASDEDGNYVPELDGMMPAYIYPGSKIEYLYTDTNNDVHGLLHLFFLNDASYGSYATNNQGSNAGGMMTYMALDINFGPALDAGDEEAGHAPGMQMLSQNYPNPFNPVTSIQFNLPGASHTKVDVFNVRGQHVKCLANQKMQAGEHTLVWNGTNQNGQPVSSGVYFYKLETDDHQEIRRMVMMK